MKAQEPTHQEIARSKLAAAARLIGDACHMLGKDIIALRVHRIDQGQSAEAIIREPSHAPARHPATPLPLPAPGQRQPGSKWLHCPCTLELERRMPGAFNWLAKTKIVHHAECSFERTTGRPSTCAELPCDCDPVFLTRKHGREFAIMPNGSLEPFHEATPSPEKFRTDDRAFWIDAAWDTRDWFIPLVADCLEFTTTGDGSTERFVEDPIESDILTRRAPEL